MPITVISAAGQTIDGAAQGVTPLCKGGLGDWQHPDLWGAPSAGLLVEGDEATLVADQAGFLHLYATQGDGWAGAGTSALALARRGLDQDALGVYRMTAQYLDGDTPFEGVVKLGPGNQFRLSAGTLTEQPYAKSTPDLPEDASKVHADRLRKLVNDFLDEHPGAVIELSGGLDSRMVLAAIPPQRRREVTAFTIGSAGSADLPRAMQLAKLCGMRHEISDLSGLATLAPQTAYKMVMDAALRMDGMGCPLSTAAFGWAERNVANAPRLSGHGGELMRGLFEFERPHQTTTNELIDRFSRRWITANNAVADSALEPKFAAHSRELAQRRIRATFHEPATDWISAIYHYQLRQRLHRWAGITITDGCRNRVVLNPLMDAHALACAVHTPVRKRLGSWYAVGVMQHLDSSLTHIPLASGVRPAILRRPLSLTRKLGENTVTGFASRVGNKAWRQVRRRNSRPAVGAPALAALVVEHWRTSPELVEPVLKTGLISHEWLEGLLSGAHGADTTTVDFLVNLTVLAG